MRRAFLTVSAFVLAVVFGMVVSLAITPGVQADDSCIPLPKGPIYWLSCDTGPSCSEPTPHYVYECWGHYWWDPNRLCMCDWIGCGSHDCD